MISRIVKVGFATSILLAGTVPASAQSTSESFDIEQLSAVISGSTTYVVESEDTLSGIAQRFFGDSRFWPTILDANSGTLGNDARGLRPGMSLQIPSLDTALSDTTPRAELSEQVTPDEWMFGEGVARAIRREYLTFESAGRIAYVDPALKEGDRVEAGHVIAHQDQRRPSASVANADAQIVQAQTQVAVAEATRTEAEANLKLAERTFQRFATLLQQNSASQQEYDEAQARLESARAAALRATRQIETAQAQISVAQASQATAKVEKDESYLTAPISGIIARFNVEQGYYFAPQYIQAQSEQALFDTVPVVLIDPSRFEIELNVPSNLFDTLSVGAPVLISIVDPNATLEERLPDEEAGPPKPPSEYRIAGKIYSISPVFDTTLRNFKVEVRTTRGAKYLRDGESVALWIGKNRK